MSVLKKDNITFFLILSIIVILIICVVSTLILKMQYNSYKIELYNCLGAITNAMIETDNTKEIEVISAIKSMKKEDIEQGKQILQKYGISTKYEEGMEELDELVHKNRIINISIIILGSFFIVLLFVIYIFLRERKIKDIVQYLKDLQNDIYSLRIEENTEGELSELQNQIAKITIMLKQQASIMKKDKKEITTALSDISHQIRTPLTSVNVMLDILKEQEVDEETQRNYLYEITKQLNSINWLVTVLLKLSRLESGMVEFNYEQIDLKKLLNEVKQSMAIPLEIKNQKFEIISEKIATMRGDYNWTKEAIVNIIKNCIEHTGENKKIKVLLSENTLYSQIIIQDEGEGIQEEELPYIFNRFYKGKNSNKESFGIGLALAKSIIEKQNGEIKVRSQKGIGTEFKIQMFKGII